MQLRSGRRPTAPIASPAVLLLTGWMLAGVAAPLSAAFGPGVFPVDGITRDAGWIWGTASQRAPDGAWMASTKDGLVVQQDGGWRFIAPPDGENLTSVHPHPLGIIGVARQSFWLHDGRWHRLPIADAPVWVARAGEETLLQAEKAVYRVDRSGAVSTVLEFKQPGKAAPIREFNGRVVVPSAATGEFWEWQDGMFIARPMPQDLKAVGTSPLRAYLRDPEFGSFFFAGDQAVPRAYFPAESAPRLGDLKAAWPAIKSRIIDRPGARLGSHLWFLTRQGLGAWSTTDGVASWSLPKADFGNGRALTLATGADGLVVGGEAGLFLVPDPGRFLYAKVPSPPLIKVSASRTPTAVFTAGGTFHLDGTPLAEVHAADQLAEDGSPIVLAKDQLRWRGRNLTVPEEPSGSYLVEVSPDLLALMRQRGTWFIRADGRMEPINLPGRGQGMATTKAPAGLLITTAEGTVRFDSTGREIGRFGEGVCGAFEISQGVFVVDSSGQLFDGAGRPLMRLPLTRLNWACEFEGRPLLLGRLAGGSYAVLAVDLAARTWQPLDLPLPRSPRALAVENGWFHVVGENDILRTRELQPLPLPAARVELLRENLRPLGETPLAADESAVVLRFPAARLAPWSSPTYTYRIGDSAPEPAAPGTLVTVPRVNLGETRLVVTATQLGRTTSTTLSILRLRPWWADWPGGILYGAAALGAIYAGVRWRTAQLRRRNRELEATVTQRTEELRQANAVKADFIVSMNHEIRNPINGIVGLTEMLRDRATAPRERLLLESLESCTAQLRATLDDVLDFSTLERGQLVLNEEDFDLAALVRGACTNPALPHFGVTLTGNIDEACWCHGDAGKIRLVLGNYLSNAAKYGLPPRAEVECTITADPASAARTVHLAVTSPGPSLSAEEQAALFQPFVRGSRARETKARGTGLGLVMCRRYARALGGDAGVESAPGRNTFWLRVSLAAAAPPVPRAGTVPTGARVLAIEDETYNRLVLGSHLRKAGLEPDWAGTAGEAISLARQHRYDLILTDCSLPDASGPEIIQRLRPVCATPMPPIVVISAYATTAMRDSLLQAGARAFVGKPIDAAKLHAALALADLPVTGSLPEPDVPAGEHINFERLLQLEAPEALLPRYAADVDQLVARIDAELSSAPANAATAVHKLRTTLLLCQAGTAATLLAALESLLESKPDSPQVNSLWQDARREAAHVAAAARQATDGK